MRRWPSVLCRMARVLEARLGVEGASPKLTVVQSLLQILRVSSSPMFSQPLRLAVRLRWEYQVWSQQAPRRRIEPCPGLKSDRSTAQAARLYSVENAVRRVVEAVQVSVEIVWLPLAAYVKIEDARSARVM